MFERTSPPRSIPGVLFIEDFDVAEPPLVAPRSPMPVPAQSEVTPPLDIDSVREEGFRVGFEAGLKAAAADISATRADLLFRLGQELSRAHTEIKDVCSSGLEVVTEAIFELLFQLLPAFFQDHGEREVRAALRSILPALGDETQLKVIMHPSLEQALKDEISLLSSSVSVAFVTDGDLLAGDFRISWHAGAVSRDLGGVCRKAVECLTSIGLLSRKGRV